MRLWFEDLNSSAFGKSWLHCYKYFVGIRGGKCYFWLKIGTFADNKLSVSSNGWKKKKCVNESAWCVGPSSLWSLLFSSVYHCQCYNHGGFILLSWCEVAPSPGLLWYGSYIAGPLIFPLKADLHFSQAKGGAAPTVCMTDDDGGDDFMRVGGWLDVTLTRRPADVFILTKYAKIEKKKKQRHLTAWCVCW